MQYKGEEFISGLKFNDFGKRCVMWKMEGREEEVGLFFWTKRL
jgi:hypothetical protein